MTPCELKRLQPVMSKHFTHKGRSRRSVCVDTAAAATAAVVGRCQRDSNTVCSSTKGTAMEQAIQAAQRTRPSPVTWCAHRKQRSTVQPGQVPDTLALFSFIIYLLLSPCSDVDLGSQCYVFDYFEHRASAQESLSTHGFMVRPSMSNSLALHEVCQTLVTSEHPAPSLLAVPSYSPGNPSTPSSSCGSWGVLLCRTTPTPYPLPNCAVVPSCCSPPPLSSLNPPPPPICIPSHHAVQEVPPLHLPALLHELCTRIQPPNRPTFHTTQPPPPNQ
jgi:hypothetical protein